MQLDPHQILPVTLMANIPAGTRGFYFAALIAETTPRETDIDGPYGDALLGMQYLVPIILESQNVAMQHNVELTDVGLKYRPRPWRTRAASVIGVHGHREQRRHLLASDGADCGSGSRRRATGARPPT